MTVKLETSAGKKESFARKFVAAGEAKKLVAGSLIFRRQPRNFASKEETSPGESHFLAKKFVSYRPA